MGIRKMLSMLFSSTDDKVLEELREMRAEQKVVNSRLFSEHASLKEQIRLNSIRRDIGDDE